MDSQVAWSNWYLPRKAPPPPIADGFPPDSQAAIAWRGAGAIGAAALFFQSFKGTELDFAIFWQVCALSGSVVLVICLLAAAISLRKVLVLEPGIVFKG